MSCCGSRYGNGRTNKPLTKLSTAVVAPMASATVTTAMAVNAGCFSSCRRANRMSLSITSLLIHHCSRRAWTGSIRVARQAGKKHAAKEASVITTNADPNASGSRGLTL